MAKGRLPRVPWPPGLRLESLLALAASLLLLGLVALVTWQPEQAAAEDSLAAPHLLSHPLHRRAGRGPVPLWKGRDRR